MASLPFSLLVSLLFFLLFLSHTKTSTGTCTYKSCGVPWLTVPIEFPFKLRGDNESESCGYPGTGVEVFCSQNNKNQTLITLPNAGDFAVKIISNVGHKLYINDPDGCLPGRFVLQGNLDLTGSPFQLSDDFILMNLTFLNCSTNDFHDFSLVALVDCLGNGNGNYSVVAMESSETLKVNLSVCQVISSALVPFDFSDRLYWKEELSSNIELQWIKPSCDYPNCEASNSKKSKTALGLGLGFGLGIPAVIISFIVLS